jgi:hypothetical protein
VTSAEAKADTLEGLRRDATRDVEGAMLELQRALAEAEADKNESSARPMRACARRLRSAWDLLGCLRLEIPRAEVEAWLAGAAGR